jgi:uracil-DNA glycosylase family 4
MTTKQHKQQLLNTLYEPYQKCLECPLGFLGRTTIVFGAGDPDANLMIIGEAPGKTEDLTGLPFVGQSGQLLAKVLFQFGIEKKDVFITSAVKCRPPLNRTPTKQETSICKNILLYNQIAIIQPLAICTLGSIAWQTLFGENIKISTNRNIIKFFQNIPVIATYHPAYMLRNRKKLPDFINDIKKALELSKMI